MNDDIMTAANNVASLYLIHYGVPGMEWYKNKAERYQPQAQYARFVPNPNGKVRGAKDNNESRDPYWYRQTSDTRRLLGAIGASSLQEKMDSKSEAQLKAATSRITAENEFKKAMINSMKADREYNELVHASDAKVMKKFSNLAKDFSKSAVGKVTGNAIKYKAYTMLRDKHGEEMANALFNNVLNVGGKKKKNGGGNGGGQGNGGN